MKLQIFEPLEEIELRNNINKIGTITNNTSIKVKSQYEENPYPRWNSGKMMNSLQRSNIQIINNEIKPNSINSDATSNPLEVLIAGCGTGDQVFQALRYKNCNITAIDISSASLAYTQRKINEYKVTNVNLIQLDILKVSLLKKKFDIIECCGVLHHLAEPEKGLNQLTRVLNDNGYMRLSFYTESSRKTVVEARNYIKAKKIEPSPENIRSFRRDVLSGYLPNLISLTNHGSDFYTTSECRDLCFHFQEHRFTINQIEGLLKESKLNFLGFLLPEEIKSLYKNYNPLDKLQTNLGNWNKFEIKYPKSFSKTIPFWVCKTKNNLNLIL